jgi:hypothetical protein
MAMLAHDPCPDERRQLGSRTAFTVLRVARESWPAHGWRGSPTLRQSGWVCGPVGRADPGATCDPSQNLALLPNSWPLSARHPESTLQGPVSGANLNQSEARAGIGLAGS